MDYRQYLLSPGWKRKRQEVLLRDDYTCQCCNKRKKKLHVHHHGYENIGDEPLSDLVTLCDLCHGAYHRYLNQEKANRPYHEDIDFIKWGVACAGIKPNKKRKAKKPKKKSRKIWKRKVKNKKAAAEIQLDQEYAAIIGEA